VISSHRKSIKEILGRDPVHPFPARMAPGIALDVLKGSSASLRVLDPMMGSGTVLAVARAQGHRASGVDIDPLAVLIAKVWTTPINPAVVRQNASNVVTRARRYFSEPPTRGYYPKHRDKGTRTFLSYWFDPYARRQLASLATAIYQEEDDATRDVLWCAFSRLIITKQAGASLAMDLSHSRPHRTFTRAPLKPFRGFETCLERVLAGCITTTTLGRGPAATPQVGDARRLNWQSDSFDLVLTSPPYLNAIDYVRCSKFSLVWMGFSIPELRNLRGTSIGSEIGEAEWEDGITILESLNLRPTLSARWEAILLRYIKDVFGVIQEVERVLVKRGKAVFVVGESMIRSTYIQNSAILTAIADHLGFSLEAKSVRMLPPSRRYLPPPANGKATGLNARMRKEVVLAFTKA
jgi:DNA modification methylase